MAAHAEVKAGPQNAPMYDYHLSLLFRSKFQDPHSQEDSDSGLIQNLFSYLAGEYRAENPNKAIRDIWGNFIYIIYKKNAKFQPVLKFTYATSEHTKLLCKVWLAHS